jgi:ABC-type phosphate transport system substrate-binding protein
MSPGFRFGMRASTRATAPIPTAGFRMTANRALLASCLAVTAIVGVATVAADEGTTNPLTELETLRYRPQDAVGGTLRLAGSTTLEHVAAAWAADFMRIHPEATVTIDGGGSEAGWRKLRAGEADVALLSRPLTDDERAAAERELPDRRVVAIAVGFDPLVWIVHADNPITALPWSPEFGILRTRSEREPSAEASGADNIPDADKAPAGAARADDAAEQAPATRVAARWVELDVETTWPDDWNAVAIQPHATDLDSGTRWHLDRLATGTVACPMEVRPHPTTADVAAAVAADRGGLGLVSGRTAWSGVRAVPLEIAADAVPLADAVSGSRRPPNLRPLFVVVTLPKEGAEPAALREFLAYVLSYSGQLDVAKDGLLPLSRAELHAQRELLGWSVER